MTGSFQWMKTINKSNILNMIRSYGPISRSEIAKKTKLTPPTVTNIVSELIESNLVRESEIGISKGGRKPILLTINAKHSFIIGIDVGGHHVRAIMADLNAEIVVQHRTTLPENLTKDDLLQTLIDVVQMIINKANVSKEKIIGIGVGMHGIVNYQEGIAVFAPNFHLSDVPIKSFLENVFQLPTYVENDARALALGETWFGHGQGIENVVCVNVGIGIGAGIVINNRLFHGQNGIAGEIGHMIVDINGMKCSCGSYGCLQTMAGGRSLRDRVIKEISHGRKTLIVNKVKNDLNKITGALIHECAIEGDALSIEVLKEVGSFLGIGVTNLINLINPTKVIIGGGVSKAENYILEPLNAVVKMRALTPKARETEIVLSKLGDNGTVIGAVTLVLQNVFSPNLEN